MSEPTEAEIQLQRAALIALGRHLDEPYGTRRAPDDLLQSLGLTREEIVAINVKCLGHQIAADPQHDPLAAIIQQANTPQAIADLSRKIADLLIARQLEPDRARTALYALQVSLSAVRIKQQSHAARQKEERLRSQKRSPQKRKTKPKPRPRKN